MSITGLVNDKKAFWSLNFSFGTRTLRWCVVGWDYLDRPCSISLSVILLPI